MQSGKIQAYRLSRQQRRLWLTQQEHVAHSAQCAIEVKGDIRLQVLTRAVMRVIQQHEVFRTTFQRQGGMRLPLQVISDVAQASWLTIDMTEYRSEGHNKAIDEVLRSSRTHPVDPAESPVWRTIFLILSATRSVLLISLPSLCADFRTLANLVEALAIQYEASLGDTANDKTVIQYVQFSEWQNETAASGESHDGKEYWSRLNLGGPARRFRFEIPSAENGHRDREWRIAQANSLSTKQVERGAAGYSSCWSKLWCLAAGLHCCCLE